MLTLALRCVCIFTFSDVVELESSEAYRGVIDFLGKERRTGVVAWSTDDIIVRSILSFKG